MTFLHSVVSIPMGWIVAAAIAGTSLMVLWIATLLSRRWYVTLRKSEETELMAHFLQRIAESLERIAAAREPAAAGQSPAQQETQPPPDAEHSVDDADTSRPVGMSMFGR